MYRYWDPPYFFPFLPWFPFTIDILFFIFIPKNFMSLPISLPGKHLTLPHSYPSIACALVHHNLQLQPFPNYDKLPDSHYLQCTTIRNIYRIFSPELKWKKLPLKQKYMEIKKMSFLWMTTKRIGGILILTFGEVEMVIFDKILYYSVSKCSRTVRVF